MRKIYVTVQTVVLIIFLLVLVFLAGGRLLFSLTPYVVMSGSMEPSIRTGSLCFVDGSDTDAKPGDVIAFRAADGILVTHRVVDVTEEGSYITRGDNNNEADTAPVSKENVTGKTLFSIPAAGYAVMKLRTPGGIAVLAVLTAAFMAVGVMISAADRRRGRRVERG